MQILFNQESTLVLKQNEYLMIILASYTTL